MQRKIKVISLTSFVLFGIFCLDTVQAEDNVSVIEGGSDGISAEQKAEVQEQRQEGKNQAKEERKEQKKEKWEQRCSIMEKRIDTRIKRYENKKNANSNRFSNMQSRFEKLVERLEAKGYDMTVLKEDLKMLDEKINKLYGTHDAFISVLYETKENPCGESEGAFIKGVGEARKMIPEIRKDIIDIKSFYREVIRPDLLQIREQVREQEGLTDDEAETEGEGTAETNESEAGEE
jgi:hypothetical protein